MATAKKIWVAGEVVTAAQLNEQVGTRVDERVLKEGDTMTGGLTVDGGTGYREVGIDRVATQAWRAALASPSAGGKVSARMLLSKDGTVVARLDLRDDGNAELIGGAQVAKVASGSYTGDGATDRTIALPFTPKKVEVVRSNGLYRFLSAMPSGTYGHQLDAGLDNIIATNSNSTRPGLTTGGFVVSGSTSEMLNESGTVYDYLAFG